MPDFTENNQFVIDGNQLYVRNENASVRGHSIDKGTSKKFSVPEEGRIYFYLAKSNQKYFKDCLETAEDLINNDYPSTPDKDKIRSKVKRLGTDFGDTDEKNIQAAKDYKKLYGNYADDKADPKVGEAYVIVSLSDKTKYPYHAAAVIAEDGKSRVTLEVFAAGQDAKTRTETGDYYMYSLVIGGKPTTFHDTWKSNPTLVGGDPITIVIEKK
ncbi:MAG: hypothetical protein F6K16_25135 [Symploca sp. SIO2B6]|nr:hypothetical protein [Symploca sp. SIO2B6]